MSTLSVITMAEPLDILLKIAGLSNTSSNNW